MSSWCRYSIPAALLLSSCSTSTPPPKIVLPSAGPAGALVKNVPVVDVHTHTFNARFLPIQNIALGKRDMHPFLSLAADPVVIAITDLITRATEEDIDPPGTAAELRLMEDVASEANFLSAVLEGGMSAKRVTAIELQNDPRVTGLQKITDGLPGQTLSNAELAGLRRFVLMFADHQQPFADKENQRDEVAHFLSCLTAAEGRIVRLFQQDQQEQVALMVSHMMDMAPTYNQREDGRKLLRFAEQEVPRVRRQQENAGGKMLYFVAYNPFRDHFDDGQPGRALAVVRRAYEEQGAFGVKIYPPSGYTPTGNRIPQRPWVLARQPGEQWDARYKPHGVRLTGAELDARLLEFLRWCVREDVPVFAHSGDGEVQARNGYGRMANPAGWRRLLEEHPELRTLRLCFGHAGGGDYWFRESDGGWGREVFELCADCPNIYCEFGIHDRIVDPANRARFSAKLARLIDESRANHPYDFSTKILYGSDWFMPMIAGSDRVNYMNAFKAAILEVRPNGASTESLYKNFFYRNALAFLNVRQRLALGGLPTELRQRLQRLLEL
jgi:predicted TIM-barrel fold metal-dependent hydrolase